MASIKLPLVFFVCMAILAVSGIAHTGAAAPSDPFTAEKLSLLGCTSFISEATKCVIDVMKNAVAPHPSCCKAFSKLNDCSPEFLKGIPSADMILIKGICALWGV
ncbi:hypothetical protein E6C27_scaffold675G00620 [Cucumis melo var. makuwa]|uniref:Uncharacterized protein n=1 Tax=Cucumis melo var. makuwa TaxID=1194695 RepID=A0A5A7U483_CUCMM|nr:hypothetical protein E6C27_scaffold675G00620 [Cucumis melo var. makuwa]